MADQSRARVRALLILAVAAVGTFALSTVAVSAMSSGSTAPPAAQFPFASFSFTGGVHSVFSRQTTSYALTFKPTFTLGPNSDGLVDPATGTLGNVSFEQDVAYPVPSVGGAVVGPVALPFSSDKLSLIIVVKGTCFTKNAVGAFVLSGPISCATAQLGLQGSNFDLSSLLSSITGNFTPNPTGANTWTGSVAAKFTDPGYTFPVATLGSGGATTLTIGNDGATGPTKKVSFGT